jgi:hypothetical protein
MIDEIHALLGGLAALQQRWTGAHRPTGLHEQREYQLDVLEVVRAHRPGFESLVTLNGGVLTREHA